jgi:PadR family transcriptional regulator, regulatory protein PadR
MRGRHFRGPRARWAVRPGHWAVRARVERFVEPSVLLLLRERAAHGYDLLEQLPELIGDHRVDMGNLYRVLRALEEEGIVVSTWDEDLPGPAKRTYELTPAGRRLLDEWATALERAQGHISVFLDRYRKEVNRASP